MTFESNTLWLLNLTIQIRRSIVGTSRDGVLTADPYYETPSIPLTVESYEPTLLSHWSKTYQPELSQNSSWIGEGVGLIYAPNDPAYYNSSAAAYVAGDGDYNVNCPSLELAAMAERKRVESYVYLFSHGPVCTDEPISVLPGVKATMGWANHGGEQAWVFGKPPACGFVNSEELALSRGHSVLSPDPDPKPKSEP